MLEQELQAGQTAVREAMRITRRIQNELTGADALTKKDKSPVTIADYAAQATVCRILKHWFPHIPIVGEERAEELRKPENKPILDKVIHYIESDPDLHPANRGANVVQSIDLGGDDPNNEIFWTLDPVDGTKGFMRGEQYATALALIVNGEVRLGVLGCPNLTLTGKDGRGYLLWAVKNNGAFMQQGEHSPVSRISVSQVSDATRMRFVESYEAAHSDQDTQGAIARELHIAGEPVRMDSQVKYAVLASGYAEIYLRIPNPHTPDYKEKIWDHAAGALIVNEAGGTVSDVFGSPLDFSQGKTLKNNAGVCAAVPSIHHQIISLIGRLKSQH